MPVHDRSLVKRTLGLSVVGERELLLRLAKRS
jgi:hypothetical protein